MSKVESAGAMRTERRGRRWRTADLVLPIFIVALALVPAENSVTAAA